MSVVSCDLIQALGWREMFIIEGVPAILWAFFWWALGSFLGSWFVGYLNSATGSPSASYIFMGVALFASVWLTLIVKSANNQQLPVGARHA